MNTDIIERCKAKMEQVNFPIPENIMIGKSRFPASGKDNSGFCILSESHGMFGDWRTGEKHSITLDGESLTPQESKLLNKKINAEKKKFNSEKIDKHKQAAIKANELWESVDYANDDHDYLKRKKVKAHEIGINGDGLVIPLSNIDGAIESLQFIKPDGEKRFLSGGAISGNFYAIEGKTETIYICEGYATGATIHEATNQTVIVAFNSGNLVPVAKSIQAKFSNDNFIICADNDRFNETNIGVDKAQKAGIAIGAKVVIPEFKSDQNKGTDFNDLFIDEGLEAVREQLTKTNEIKVNQSGLIESNEGLKRVRETRNNDIEILITTFRIKPTLAIEVPNSGEHLKISLIAGNCSREVTFPPDAWLNGNAFMRCLPTRDFAFFGSNNDVQRILAFISTFTFPTIKGVKVAGFHNGVFITEDGALDKNGVVDGMTYINTVDSHCKLLKYESANQIELEKMAELLALFNGESVVMPILGWTVACFFKTRIHNEIDHFPFLNIAGEAGSGKTTTGEGIIQRIFAMCDEPKAISEQTNFTLIKLADCSNTIPLLLEENKSSHQDERKKTMISNYLRGAYNNLEASRGRANQTIETYQNHRPPCVIGETGFTEPALLDRCVPVEFNSITSKKHLSKFNSLQKLPIEKLGRALLEYSLSISDKDVKKILKEQIKKVGCGLTDRPRDNAAVVRFGLKILEQLLNVDFNLSVVDKTIKVNVVGEGKFRKSAIDRILEAMMVMSTCRGNNKILFHGAHYQLDRPHIRIYIAGIYPEFLKWANTHGFDGDILPESTFKKQIQSEPYFHDMGKHRIGKNPRNCIVLSVAKMKSKGLDVVYEWEKYQ